VWPSHWPPIYAPRVQLHSLILPPFHLDLQRLHCAWHTDTPMLRRESPNTQVIVISGACLGLYMIYTEDISHVRSSQSWFCVNECSLGPLSVSYVRHRVSLLLCWWHQRHQAIVTIMTWKLRSTNACWIAVIHFNKHDTGVQLIVIIKWYDPTLLAGSQKKVY
jgi:hypothetical protein